MQLHQIVISTGHDYWVRKGEPTLQHGTQSPEEVVGEAGRGIVGDRYYHGKANRKGQVTFMTVEVVDEIQRRFDLPGLDATLFRRNLIVSAANRSTLLMTRFELQGVAFEGSQKCRPSEWMDRMIAPGVRQFLEAKFCGGLRAKVITSGVLRLDAVTDS